MKAFKSYKQMAQHYITMCKFLRVQVEYDKKLIEGQNQLIGSYERTFQSLGVVAPAMTYETTLGKKSKTEYYDELRVD